jgi:hypothetical protein
MWAVFRLQMLPRIHPPAVSAIWLALELLQIPIKTAWLHRAPIQMLFLLIGPATIGHIPASSESSVETYPCPQIRLGRPRPTRFGALNEDERLPMRQTSHCYLRVPCFQALILARGPPDRFGTPMASMERPQISDRMAPLLLPETTATFIPDRAWRLLDLLAWSLTLLCPQIWEPTHSLRLYHRRPFQRLVDMVTPHRAPARTTPWEDKISALRGPNRALPILPSTIMATAWIIPTLRVQEPRETGVFRHPSMEMNLSTLVPTEMRSHGHHRERHPLQSSRPRPRLLKIAINLENFTILQSARHLLALEGCR